LGRIEKKLKSAPPLLLFCIYIPAVVEEKKMTSFTEKPEITRQEWMEKLENVHLQRTDMNRLVMNYLVTGMITFSSYIYAGGVYTL
jgi:hypothetical protein